MKPKQKKKTKQKKIVPILFLMSALVIFSFIIGISLGDSSKENHLLKTILIAEANIAEVSIDSQWADHYYDEASYAYEYENYNLVESNCRLAREYYSKEVQGYEKLKVELKETGIKDILIHLYINILENLIDKTYNMFEACEHFESAARYYGVNDYDMGGSEIGRMNEKIKAHDEAIKEYNQLLEEFGIELKKRIK